jgi:hypothetical protein
VLIAALQQTVYLVHVAAFDAERFVVLLDRFGVGPVKQAVHPTVSVVEELNLPHAELIGVARRG